MFKYMYFIYRVIQNNHLSLKRHIPNYLSYSETFLLAKICPELQWQCPRAMTITRSSILQCNRPSLRFPTSQIFFGPRNVLSIGTSFDLELLQDAAVDRGYIHVFIRRKFRLLLHSYQMLGNYSAKH